MGDFRVSVDAVVLKCGRVWRGGMRDPLACTSFSLLWQSSGRAGDGGVDGGWRLGSGGSWLDGGVADDVVPQGFPSGLPGPVGWQVQHGFAGRGGEAGGHVDQVAAQGGAAGHGVVTAGESARCASRLWVITAQASQAQLAANSPEGI